MGFQTSGEIRNRDKLVGGVDEERIFFKEEITVCARNPFELKQV